MIRTQLLEALCQKNDKGLLGGSCNRHACDERPALWWNRYTHAHYCVGCARKINEGMLATNDTQKFKLQPLERVMSLEQFHEYRASQYSRLTRFSSGEMGAVAPYLYTFGVVIGLTTTGYRCRWCYATAEQAIAAIDKWDGGGDPPGPWIKQKGRNERGKAVDRSREEQQSTGSVS